MKWHNLLRQAGCCRFTFRDCHSDKLMANKAIVGEKLGMTQVWDDENKVVPVTVLRAAPARVVQVRTSEKDGYSASGDIRPQGPQEVDQGAGRPPTAARWVSSRAGSSSSLRLDDISGFEVGQEIGADTFEAGEAIDVTAVSKAVASPAR